MNDNDAIINEFLTESYENLDQLDRDLIELEQNPEEKGILAGIFRTIHTIKGILGTVVVQERVTDLIDVESVVLQAAPSFNETETALLTSGGA